MKPKTTHLLGVLLCVSVAGGFSQTLLTSAQVTSGGAPWIADWIQPRIGMAVTVRTPRIFLFEDLQVRISDVGQTYSVGPADDPDFGAFTALLTDGNASSFIWLVDGSGTLAPETSFFTALPEGNNGVDFGGFQIDHYTLHIDALAVVPPGQDWNQDGIWNGYNYTATFSVYGQPVPEPTTAVMMGLGAFALCARANLVRRPR